MPCGANRPGIDGSGGRVKVTGGCVLVGGAWVGSDGGCWAVGVAVTVVVDGGACVVDVTVVVSAGGGGGASELGAGAAGAGAAARGGGAGACC